MTGLYGDFSVQLPHEAPSLNFRELLLPDLLSVTLLWSRSKNSTLTEADVYSSVRFC